MNRQNHHLSSKFCPWDGGIIFFVVVLAGLLTWGLSFSFGRDTGEKLELAAVLSVTGEPVWQYSLSTVDGAQSYTLHTDSGDLTVTVQPNRAAITASDCADQICVDTGWLTLAGQKSVCLPFRAVLEIKEIPVEPGTSLDPSTHITTPSYDAISR